MITSKDISEKIKKARIDKNITQKEMGEYLGIRRDTLRHKERNVIEFKVSEVIDACKKLEINILELFTKE